MSNEEPKLFVDNSALVNVVVEGRIIYAFRAHPNMLILPIIGQKYNLDETRVDGNHFRDKGTVVFIDVDHTVDEKTNTLQQTVTIQLRP
jgi:hypothetical protein